MSQSVFAAKILVGLISSCKTIGQKCILCNYKSVKLCSSFKRNGWLQEMQMKHETNNASFINRSRIWIHQKKCMLEFMCGQCETLLIHKI